MREPTRVTDISSTLIDHAYSNRPENITNVFIPAYSISDHYPVCLTRRHKNANNKGPCHNVISYRSTKEFNENSFMQDLSMQPWSVIEYMRPNDVIGFLYAVFLQCN